jgi:hypothetical protein
MTAKKREPVHVAMHGPTVEGVIGVAASPPVLPEPVLRWPGEPLDALAQRAAGACIGASGLVVLRLLYAAAPGAADLGGVGVSGSSWHGCRASSSSPTC